jgi:aryl-alcohol dehydrogenase-like predicted oxidoreductase
MTLVLRPGAPKKLALGTAQFGTDYGVSNRRGQVPSGEVRAILEDAAARGVDLLDTAAAYGDAEAVLGGLGPVAHSFRVVTKTARLGPGGVPEVVATAHRSLARLGRNSLDGLFVHAASDLQGLTGDTLWEALRGLKEGGLFRAIGISAYAEDDPLALARRFRPDLMQLPVSLLDQRLIADGTVAGLAELGVEVHARSIFLQGLVFLDPRRLPASLAHAGPSLAERARMIADAGTTPLAAALHFVLARPEIARVLVGVTSLAEWREIAEAATAPAPDLDWTAMALDDPLVLNPVRWQ